MDIYESIKEMYDNSLRVKPDGCLDEVNEWLSKGRAIYCVGRNSHGIVFHFHKPEPEKIEPQEELYICDHADDGCRCAGELYKPHALMQDPHKTCPLWGRVKSIPYKEKEEPEKSCDTCERNNSKGCISPVQGGINEDCLICKPKEEKPEPKTKRVAVIWFGDVPECTDYVDIRARQHGNEWDKGKEFKVDTIDPDRLKYKEALKGEQVFDTNGGFYEYDGPDGFKSRFLILAPPTPEPETVEQVLERMPKTKSYSGVAGVDDYWVDMLKWEKDLKAAQDREEG